ncbi:unnamed protein product [Sympodiomycopsis kandeliae]
MWVFHEPNTSHKDHCIVSEVRMCNRKRDRGKAEDDDSIGRNTEQQQDSQHKRTAASRGNFSSYYNIRNQTADDVDARVKILLSRLQTPVFGQSARIHRILDVGCNEGRVGIELALQLPDILSRLIGVDTDNGLVQKARQSASKAGIQSTSSPVLGHKTCRFFCNDWVFPHRSAKLQGTARDEFFAEESKGFDLVLALSITKWIHIHESDIGLLHFFQRLVDVLRPNGLLFFEPQPDRSYEQARRELSTELRSRSRRLRFKMDDFVYILEHYFGLEPVDLDIDWQSDAAKTLSRPLFLFRKPASHSAFLDHKAIDVILEDQAAPHDIEVSHHRLPFPWVSRDPKAKRNSNG